MNEAIGQRNRETTMEILDRAVAAGARFTAREIENGMWQADITWATSDGGSRLESCQPGQDETLRLLALGVLTRAPHLFRPHAAP